MFEHVRVAREKHRQLNDAYRNKNTKERRFEVGQLVYVLCKIITGNSGLICRKRGPYVIKEISSHGQTALLCEVSTGKITKRHFAHMLPLTETRMTPRLNSNWDESLRAFLNVNNEDTHGLPPA
jgi:hypothetical protein